MKIPKTLKMFGYVWKIKKTKEGGASFDIKTKIISIGYGCKEQESNLLHEIMEIVLVEKRFRLYAQDNNMEYLFYFNHTGFEDFSETLYGILKDNKLI